MNKVLLTYFFFALLLIAGLATHGSDTPEILIYSKKYFMVLLVLALIFLVAIPWWIRSFISKNGTKNFFSAIFPSVITLLLAYFIGHYWYYATQEHMFEPFLQMPPQEYKYDSPKDTSTLRVLCIGGSTTRNIRLDTLNRYPSQLHQILKEKITHKNVEVLNAGMDWYTTKHTIINYTAYCRDFNPDVVVIMHAINDLYRSFSPKALAVGPYRSDYTHFYGPSIAGAQPPAFEGMLNKIFRKFWFEPKFKARSFDISEFLSLSDFERYYSTAVELFQNDGAKVIIVSQPYVYQKEVTPEVRSTLWMQKDVCEQDGNIPDTESMGMAMDAYNSKAASVAAKYNTTFVHGEPALPKTLEYFVDDVHYTPIGAKTLATAIAEGIVSSQ